MSPDPDNEIRRRIRADDPDALELIYEHYAQALFGYLSVMLRSRAAAEDALQDLFVLFAEKRQRLAEARNLRAYLWQMTRNQAMTILRRQPRQEVPTAAIDEWLAAPGDTGIPAEEQQLIRQALAELPADQREVVVLKVYQNCTFQEIAERLELSLNTAASRYRYAMDKLRKALAEVLSR